MQTYVCSWSREQAKREIVQPSTHILLRQGLGLANFTILCQLNIQISVGARIGHMEPNISLHELLYIARACWDTHNEALTVLFAQQLRSSPVVNQFVLTRARTY